MQLEAFLPFVSYPDANSDAAAANAVAVAAWLKARLHAAAFNADIPDVSSALSNVLLNLPEMIRDAETLSRQRGDQLLAQAAEQAARLEVAFSAGTERRPLALLADAAALRARYFDVSLVGWEATNPTSRATAEAVVFGAGRPTVVLPERASHRAFENVAIAWDGSRVAARAVADAWPFLERSSSVHVLTVMDEKPLDDKEGGKRLTENLRRRGFSAEAMTVMAEDCPIATRLQERAIESGASLLVMGGYGHSRLRDFVLGGATEGVLGDLRLPVLMSH